MSIRLTGYRAGPVLLIRWQRFVWGYFPALCAGGSRKSDICIFAFIAACLIFSLQGIKAQANEPAVSLPQDSVYYFKARLIDSIDKKPVAFAHIVNYSRTKATISDTLGYFYIRVNIGDTVYISAIGYRQVQRIAHDSLRNNPVLQDLPLSPLRYPIGGVSINPLGNYDYFTRRMVEMNLPEYGYRMNEDLVWDIERGTDTLDIVPMPILSPVTFLYNWLSKEGKSKRKLQAIIAEEIFEDQIAYKYSPEIVTGLTGYTGFELYHFMDFCNFSKSFLLEANYLEIASVIMIYKAEFETIKDR